MTFYIITIAPAMRNAERDAHSLSKVFLEELEDVQPDGFLF